VPQAECADNVQNNIAVTPNPDVTQPPTVTMSNDIFTVSGNLTGDIK
jgi:hypothetical protein